MSLQVYAQYDYPNVPNQEDFAQMMPKEVSGNYSNEDDGISVVFPSGWSGMEMKLNDPKSGTSMTSVQVMEGGMEANMDNLENGEYQMIILSIVAKTESETLPKAESPNPEQKSKCNYVSAETITFSDKKAMKLESECSDESSSIKMRSYHFATKEKIITLSYATSPSSEFESNLNKFEDSVKTLSIKNLIDLSYEIPEELTEKSDETTDDKMKDDKTTEKKFVSPKKQVEQGLSPKNVNCNEGKQLLFKITDGKPVCVSKIAAEKLVARGWASQ